MKNVFFVGIKGVGMSNIALVMQGMGDSVSGSDIVSEFLTDEVLKQHSIKVIADFSASDLPHETNLVVYSGANSGSKNPQVVEAKKRGIEVVSQAELLGKLMEEFKISISICGTHGKTTTTAFVAYMLQQLGANPTYIIGTSTFNDVEAGKFGSKDYLVLEADEYAVDPPHDMTPKFHFLHPDYILCTTIDFDHPDVYKDIEDTKRAYRQFFLQVKKTDGTSLFFPNDNSTVMSIASSLKTGTYMTSGFSQESDFQISDVEYGEESTQLSLTNKGSYLGQFEISLFGEKNVLNIAGGIVLLLQLGFSTEDIRRNIKGFKGTKRRFEHVAYVNDIHLFDDYAHHPAEIMATIDAVRRRFPNKRVVVVFQPHTYSRTQMFQDGFIKALAKADKTYLIPIFGSAREIRENYTVTSESMAENARKQSIQSIEYSDLQDIPAKLSQFVQRGDIVFTMGAGDVYKLKDDIIKVLNTR